MAKSSQEIFTMFTHAHRKNLPSAFYKSCRFIHRENLEISHGKPFSNHPAYPVRVSFLIDVFVCTACGALNPLAVRAATAWGQGEMCARNSGRTAKRFHKEYQIPGSKSEQKMVVATRKCSQTSSMEIVFGRDDLPLTATQFRQRFFPHVSESNPYFQRFYWISLFVLLSFKFAVGTG